MSKKQATSIQKFVKKKFKVMAFKGTWKELLGTPATNGSWIIYGDSGHGKTTFSMKLIKYLSSFKKCAYVPLEEGLHLTFQMAVKEANLLSSSSRIKLWEDYTVEDIDEELSKPRAPEIIFIDSAQYFKSNEKSVNELTKFEYKELSKRYPNVIFIYISHAEKGDPKGGLAKSIYFGSHVCLEVKDFSVSPMKNRYGGKVSFDINEL
ncbi:ATP-binding protein [Brumimicrobium mesophilum]|uniref:ATP-binding protein n=1 Tax=Brumimicrobium mesophilum TaxID=392717 RepID=UPI000D142376|nr:hypothetical protein [Brumimicrobium mesophilum]